MSTRIKQDISIGGNLKQLRNNVCLSQEQVASKLQTMDLSVSREMVSQMELGKYSIRVSVLLALCEIYNANISDFFFGLSLNE